MKNGENIQNHEDNIIEITKNINEINFSLKIYFAKDKQSIIFKVEQDNIQTYYYYEKFYLLDFKNNNKRFNLMNNLNEIYLNIKYIVDKYSTKIEEETTNKIKIEFSNNSEIIATFSLRKKILSQNRLNPILEQQIQLNKNKIKAIKKQASKLEKSVNNQTDMINDINKKIDSINENLDNIIKEINNFKENLKNNEIYSENKEKKEIKKENSKRKNKEDNNEEIHKRAFCNIKKIYELLLFISIFIIILISHLFYRIKLVENNDLLEKIKKNKIKTQYSILNAIENLTPDDMKYLQNVIDEGSSMDKLFSFEIDDTKKKNKVGNMNADKHLKENNDNIIKDENNIEKKSKINEKDEDR